MLKKNSSGPDVLNLISDLRALAYYHGPDTSHFDNEVYKSVRAFQMQNVDVAGRPLVVDGKVGPVTRGALDIPAAELVFRSFSHHKSTRRCLRKALPVQHWLLRWRS